MTSPATSQTTHLLENKIQLSSFFPEGHYEEKTKQARRIVIAKELAEFIPEQACSYFLQPQQANLPGILTGNGNQFVRFELSQIQNLVKIDSVKLEITFTNSGVAAGYVAPTPCFFSRVDLSFDDVNSSPAWSDLSSNMVGSHLFQLMLRDRPECLKILQEEGYVPERFVFGGEDNLFISSPGANQFQLQKSSPLEAFAEIPPPVAPATSRSVTRSFYLLGSPLTQTGFCLGMLRGSQKCSLNFSFRAGSVWYDTTGGPLTISSIRLSLEGKSSTPEVYQGLIASLNQPGRSIVIPYARNVNQFFDRDFTQNVKDTVTLTQFTKNLLGIFFYVAQRNPNMSSGVGTPSQRANEFIQNFTPQILDVDVAGGTSTLTAGSAGEGYQLYDISIKLDSAQVANTPEMSALQMQQYGMSATDNKSYLIPIYGRSLLINPFSTDLYKACVEQRAFRNGMVQLNGNTSIDYTPAENILNSRLNVFGIQAAQLVYSAEEGLIVQM